MTRGAFVANPAITSSVKSAESHRFGGWIHLTVNGAEDGISAPNVVYIVERH